MQVIEGKSPADVARLVLKHGAWATAELVRGGRPRHILHFYGRSLGDDLMCTAVLREMRRRGYRSVWMMSRFPELFERNPEPILREIPLGRTGGPDDLKGIALLLASDASNFITGAIIPVDGGTIAW